MSISEYCGNIRNFIFYNSSFQQLINRGKNITEEIVLQRTNYPIHQPTN